MSRPRLLFFWLLVLLLPLQGFAATTKLWCGNPGTAGHQHVAAAAARHAHGQPAADAAQAPPHAHEDAAASPGIDAPAHQCGLCAACCQAAGAAPAPHVVLASALPQARAGEVTGRIADRFLGHPEKPPRG